jgi:hypothetical protein
MRAALTRQVRRLICPARTPSIHTQFIGKLVIVGSAFSARFAHSRDKQVSRVTKCPVEILYGKPHQKEIFSFTHLKMRVFCLITWHKAIIKPT